jgi:hypothetical protein
VLAYQRVAELYACPFCRQLFAVGERTVCPDCDIRVAPLAELPPSHDAEELEPEEPVAPEDEVHAWHYLGRARGPLALVALSGIVVFFAPWLHESAPEIRTWSGFEFAQRLAYIWAGGIAWFVMLPLVVSRRSIRQMRGARVAVGFLAAMVLLTVAVRLGVTPKQHPLIPIRYAWGWGMYASGCLAAMALVLTLRFGGSTADMPSTAKRPTDETVH